MLKQQLTSVEHQDNSFLIGESPYLSNITFFLPTLNLCIGIDYPQCFNLGISITRSSIVVESVNIFDYQFQHQYNTSLSSTYSDALFLIQYLLDSYFVHGKIVQDIVHLPNQTMNEINKTRLHFDLITSIRGFPRKKHIDGYIGLFIEYPASKNKAFHETDCSFVNYLYNTSMIKEQIVMLNYKKEINSSIIAFGESYGNYPRCNKTIQSLIKNSWYCLIDSILIGNEEIKAKPELTDLAMFDSLKNIIMAPQDSGSKIFFELIKLSEGKCHDKHDFDKEVLICDKNIDLSIFPDLKLKMLEAEIIIKWKNVFIWNSQKEIYVSLLVYFFDQRNHWVIGIPGLTDNRFVINYEDMSLGFLDYIDNIEDYYIQKVCYSICYIILFIGMILLIVNIKAK